MKEFVKALTPTPILHAYHYSLALLGALIFGFPSSRLFVIAVTGTKGKSTTVELIATILKEAGYNVASASTIRFAVGDESQPNLFKMTMPGRFYLQQFLRRARGKGATHAVIEMTSEGAKQFRHKGISLNALVFTNLRPEHLEAHGGLENYANAKLSLGEHLARSSKRPRYMVANVDDAYGKKFLEFDVEIKSGFSLVDAQPYSTDDKSVRFLWRGKDLFTVPLPGVFNLNNILAAMTLCEALGVSVDVMKKALEHIGPIAGRAERIERGQPFTVVVDYAHTPDSLKALYETFIPSGSKNKQAICVLGSTGGGRDSWKRPEMGKVVDEFCTQAYLTNDDPYDEDPKKILEEIAKGFSKHTPRQIVNRRSAIREALTEAKDGDVVLITGKGTDPYLMGPGGTREPWSDKSVVEEELAKLGYH